MNLRSRFLFSALVSALAFTALPGHTRPPVPISHPSSSKQLQWDSKKFMHVSELKPGMRGYALTVFKGTKIERFGIEILGVVAKFNQGKDYIMFRATSGPPVTRGLGIAEGMSGSPVYINGRLVGAISSGFQFSKDPIGFATPIEDMFDAWSPDLPSKIPSIGAAAPGTGVAMPGAGMAPSDDSFGGRNFASEMPLTVSGMNAQGRARLGAALAPFHFHVMAGAGRTEGIDTNPLAKNPSLVPGSAVGVALIQGDFDVNATGTVTYRDGNRLLLFGHPFQNLGPIDAALTTAYVVDVFPSYQTSFKLGSPIKTVGRIFQDRPFSVGGVIGPMPQMIPMTVAVNDESIHRRKTFRVRIIDHPLLTGRFIPAVASAAIAQVHGDPGDSMATVTMDVDAEEIGHIRRTNRYYDGLNIDQAAAGDLSSLISLLSSNPFYPLSVKSVTMSVTIQNRHDTAEIDHLFINQSKFAPGDTATVGVVLKPYKQPQYTQMVSVKIPLSVPDGVLPLTIQGGSGGGGGLSLLAALFGGQPAQSDGTAANIAQLVRHFVEKPENNQIVARLTLPTSAVTVRGEKLTGLPPTLSALMKSGRTTGYRSVRDEVKSTQTVPYLVSGSQTLNITIQRKDISEPTAAATPPAPAPTDSTAPPSAPPILPPPPDDGDDLAFQRRTVSTEAAPAAPSEAAVQKASAPASTTGSVVTTTGTTAAADGATDTPQAAKPIGRLPSIWRQNTMADFSGGLLTNVAVSSLGDLSLAPSLTKAADTPENYVWAIQPDGKGSVYLATGDGGVIDKMGADGKITPFFTTGELEVTSLALDSSGNLYAGTAPNGIIYRIAPDGHGGKFFLAKEKYVTALLAVGGRVYAATGGGTARIYRLDPGSTPALPASAASSAPFFSTPEAHILSLAADKAGNLYAGAAPDGIVYKITPDGSSSVFYDAAEPEIAALAVDSSGNIYAGTAPTGAVYRIASDGAAKRLPGVSGAAVTSLTVGAAEMLYAAAGTTIYRISPDDSVQSYSTPSDPQFISLAIDPAAQTVYAGTGTVGSVFQLRLGGPAQQGHFESTVHDAGRLARWGTLTWQSSTPAGSMLTLQTRSGNVPHPDESWSAWSAPLVKASGETIVSPPGRYLQYQASFSGTGATALPKLSAVSAYYLPRNQPPTVGITKPTAADAVSKTAAFQWSASDPDKDTLSYDLSYSADGGKTWTPITTRARLTAQTKTKSDAKSAAAPAPAALPDLKGAPAGVQAQIRAQIDANAAEVSSVPAAAKPAQNLKETSYSWDTTLVPDGLYQIEVVASDRPSNPVGALTAKAVSAPFLIANSAPTLTLAAPSVHADKSIVLPGKVQTGLAFVQSVQATVDNGEPVAAAPDDGLFDSSQEAFTLTLPAVSSGTHKIEVQARDQAGNKATQSVSVTVP